MKLLRIGYGNAVVASRVRQILGLKSSERRRLRQHEGTLSVIDATAGHHTRSIVVTDSGHLILSSVSPDVLEHKLRQL